MGEAVNHPAHYNAPGRKECIEEMLDIFGIEKVKAFCKLNSYKYNYRHEMKNGEEDLAKANWYDSKYFELEEKDEKLEIAYHYGLDAQEQQLIEEMAELTQAICKRKRVKANVDAEKTKTVMDNYIEELADVSLVLWQVISLLGVENLVNAMIDYKTKRTIERICGNDRKGSN